MKTKDVIKNAERVTLGHIYGDGTALYDLCVDGLAYTIRVYMSDFVELRYGTALTTREDK